MHIVLLEPEIPGNTGNISRTCAATGTSLHLIRPLGFKTDESSLKRAGLDYWHLLDLHYYDSFADFCDTNKTAELYFATTKAPRTYTDIVYPQDAWFVFGKESAGIPEEILEAYPDFCIRIPLLEGARSLNVSNSVAVILFEALRQHQFAGLQGIGKMGKLE